MRKYFSIVVILISISLLGVFYVQYSQLSKAYKDREAEVKEEIISAISSVGDEISVKIFLANKKYNEENLNYIDLGFQNTLFFKYYTKDIISVQEVKDLIKSKLKNNGLLNLKFEFAIVNTNKLVKKNFSTYAYYKTLRENENSSVFSYPIYYSNYLSEDVSKQRYQKPEERIFIIVPSLRRYVFDQFKWHMIASILFSAIILVSFTITVRLMLNQKKLAEMKEDFISNITHELKTPISTVSLAADAIRASNVSNQQDTKVEYFTNIIKEENKRLENIVDVILNSAKLEKQEAKLVLVKISLHQIITSLLNKFKLKLQEKKSKVVLQLKARRNMIFADEVHFSNAISNIIDNAIKYSKPSKSLDLSITTKNARGFIILTVEDNGIGMSKRIQKKIFDKFYRATTGNLHQTKGHGLGIYYAKTVFDQHKATIAIDSSLGKGSKFEITIPLSVE